MLGWDDEFGAIERSLDGEKPWREEEERGGEKAKGNWEARGVGHDEGWNHRRARMDIAKSG